MNAPQPGPLRRLIHNAWNEPRHFFFWISLCSPPILILMVLIASAASRVPPAVPWIAFAALVGFLVGLPAFILSWIPPLRRWFARLLQHKLLASAVLITFIGLLYAVENWRGRTAWNQFRTQNERNGIPFAINAVIPPPLPDDQNFFCTPVWDFLRFTSSSNGLVWKYPPESRDKIKVLDAYGPAAGKAPTPGDLQSGQRTDLAAFQTFYRSTNNLFSAGPNGTTNFFPVAEQPQTPAADVLLALSKYSDNLEQLRSAAQTRTEGRFWINYESGIGSLFPHLAYLKGCSQFLRIRATALLAAHQSEAALDDLVLALRLNDKIRREPILISQLVRIAIFQITLQTIWEGLADHRWNEPQLATIEKELARLNFLQDYRHAMDGERLCFSMWAVDMIQRTGDFMSLTDASEVSNDSTATFERGFGLIVLRVVPSGWFDQNRLSLSRMLLDFVRPMVDVERQIVAPQKIRQSAARTANLRATPYDLFSRLLLPALDRAAKRFGYAQNHTNLARLAIACERFCLATGNYPAALNDLTPGFLNQLPHDLINGSPFQYHRTATGSFVLYSVGWNETDDGGKMVRRTTKDGKEGTVDPDQGDWVWQYPEN